MKLSKTWAKAIYFSGFVFIGLYGAVILAALLLGQQYQYSLFMWSFQWKIPLAVLGLALILILWYGERQYRAYLPDGKLPRWLEISGNILKIVCTTLDIVLLRLTEPLL